MFISFMDFVGGRMRSIICARAQLFKGRSSIESAIIRVKIKFVSFFRKHLNVNRR